LANFARKKANTSFSIGKRLGKFEWFASFTSAFGLLDT